MLIHVCIVILTTTQILTMVQTTGSYSRSQANLFFYKFLNHDDD